MSITLVALAAISSISATTSVLAQSTVEIYGRAHVGYDAIYKTTGGTATPGGGASTSAEGGGAVIPANTAYDVQNRRRVADDGSRIGFRINEDLGGGLSAKSVIETGINIDTATGNGQSDMPNSGTGFLGSRDAWVGLSNATGDIRLGRQNVFWSNGAIEDVSANRIHFAINGMYTSPSSGWIANPMARVENTVKFVGNSALGPFAGSEFWFSHPSAAESGSPNALNTANPTGEAKAKAQGLTLKFNQGPWAAQFDYGKFTSQLNGVGTATGQTFSAAEIAAGTAAAKTLDNSIKAQKLGLAYSYAEGSKVYFINSRFQQTFSDPVASANVIAVTAAPGTNTLLGVQGGDRKQSSNLFGVQHRLGNWELHAVYAKQGDVSIGNVGNADDSGSKAYTLGARYDLSKRTAITTAYTQIKNGAQNNINNSGGGQSSVAALGYGAKLTQFGVSILHNF